MVLVWHAYLWNRLLSVYVSSGAVQGLYLGLALHTTSVGMIMLSHCKKVWLGLRHALRHVPPGLTTYYRIGSRRIQKKTNGRAGFVPPGHHTRLSNWQEKDTETHQWTCWMMPFQNFTYVYHKIEWHNLDTEQINEQPAVLVHLWLWQSIWDVVLMHSWCSAGLWTMQLARGTCFHFWHPRLQGRVTAARTVSLHGPTSSNTLPYTSKAVKSLSRANRSSTILVC